MGKSNLIQTIKYLLVVVEGKTDRTTFENALRLLVKKYCQNKDLEIDVVNGDTLVMDKDGNIISYNQEEETVSKQIERKIKDLHLKTTDIVGVAMITDLDACFAPEDFFVEDINYEKAFYDQDANKCLRKDIARLKTIRLSKFNVVRKMHNKSHISIDGNQIKYKLFYLNVDLEWVFYQLLNCTKLEKIQLSDDFDTNYGDDLDKFEAFICALPTVGDDFESSWEPVVNRTMEPMSVATNIKYLIDWIKSIE